jgi:hypothetical protein
MLAGLDKPPPTEGVVADVLEMYKKITRLQCVQRCGQCGTTRHATQPFWSLGMRVCRYCLQENLVSHTVLAERYWVDVWSGKPMADMHAAAPDITVSFADAIAGRVFYLREYGTSRQRLEYTNDPLDYAQPRQRAAAVTWLFWRPHLERIMELGALEREARTKHRAAETLRAIVRRAITLRTLAGTHTRKDQALTCRGIRGTTMIEWRKRPDKRLAVFKLQRGMASDPIMLRYKFNPYTNRKLSEYEDRLCIPPRPGLWVSDEPA